MSILILDEDSGVLQGICRARVVLASGWVIVVVSSAIAPIFYCIEISLLFWWTTTYTIEAENVFASLVKEAEYVFFAWF